MTTDHDSPAPPAALLEHLARFVTAFDAGDAIGVDRTYEDLGVLVPAPGVPMAGPARLAATTHMLSMGLPIDSRPRQIYVADDIALLIVDWSIRGTTPDGTRVDMAGTAADVARRGADGVWRYVIDNPHGTRVSRGTSSA